jgi:heme oxygenase
MPVDLKIASSAAKQPRPVVGVVHKALRAATRNDHALLDRMLLRLNLSLADDYRLFLSFHIAALPALRRYWRPEDREDFEAMIRCLQFDLGAMADPTQLPIPCSEVPADSHGIGIAYVIRGSRLGAAALRRSIPDSFQTSYLDFSPAVSWPQFLAQLECIAENPNAIDKAILAARCAFDSFATEFHLGLAQKPLA